MPLCPHPSPGLPCHSPYPITPCWAESSDDSYVSAGEEPLEAPLFEIPLQNVVVAPGADVLLKCIVTANPPPQGEPQAGAREQQGVPQSHSLHGNGLTLVCIQGEFPGQPESGGGGMSGEFLGQGEKRGWGAISQQAPVGPGEPRPCCFPHSVLAQGWVSSAQ